MNKLISIVDASYVGDYKIRFRFNDDKVTLLDFGDFINNSTHPDIKKFQDKELFKQFNLSFGDIEWFDYELAFPIYDLYEAKI